MRIAFEFLGCRLNEAENERLARELTRAGHCMVSIQESPEVIVLNTCGVTTEAMRKSRNFARRMASQNSRLLVLMGCAVELMAAGETPLSDEELMDIKSEQTPLRILRIRNSQRSRAATMILDCIDEIQGAHVLDEAERAQAAASYRLRMRSFIKIQDGCNNQCTYCAVRLARGRERSESTASILNEIRACLELGEREIVLTGVQLGAWREENRRIEHLIRDILDQTPVQRLRLGSIEPWHVRPELWELWEDSRLCPHFHIPVQSGSDGVLTLMRRRTPIDVYLDKIEAMRREIPNVRISTDLIVGFPGETDEMWQETMSFIRQARFDEAHLFRFSPRPNTIAATLPNPVAGEIKRARWNEAEQCIRTLQAERFESQLGTMSHVLWEQLLAQEGTHVRWMGYAENYLRFERLFDENCNMRGQISCEKFGRDDFKGNFI